jgi:hypothetical protein
MNVTVGCSEPIAGATMMGFPRAGGLVLSGGAMRIVFGAAGCVGVVTGAAEAFTAKITNRTAVVTNTARFIVAPPA